MKFSTATLLALANGIVAMPWAGSSGKSNEEITLRIKVSQSPMHQHHEVPAISKHDICWLICASEAPDCPEGWYSSKQGDCWTCCRSTDDNYGL
ncbi:hypothetical protein QQX98_005015 [Neonectria punicea]|uniref:Uncharacterized protein n=1 Tax=Neonectria punicea TaxID=979145 RepID=A0ABR1H6Z9_9HYPO